MRSLTCKVVLFKTQTASLLLFASLVLTFTAAGILRSQEMRDEPAAKDSPSAYRSQILEGHRKAKVDSLEAPHQGRIEKTMLFIENNRVIEHLRYGYYGFFLKFGGLSTKAKKALGIRYAHDELPGRSAFWWTATLSFNRYQQYEIEFDNRPIESLPLHMFIYSRYQNFPQEEYFGLGPNSLLQNRANYRIEAFLVDVGAKTSVFPGLDTGLRTGHFKSRTAPGTSNEVLSLEETFTPSQAIGFSESIEHWITEFFASLDLRDSAGNPRSGFSLSFRYRFFDERHSDTYDFFSTSTEFQVYIPFLHKHRVLALRVLAMNSDGRNGGEVPFYSLPFIGGSRYIRGYSEFRFRDHKAVMVNFEYRFEAFIGCDVAVFTDFGQVQHHWEKFHFSGFKHSYGGGLRFNTAKSVFLRLDVGHGREGTQFYVKFDNVF